MSTNNKQKFIRIDIFLDKFEEFMYEELNSEDNNLSCKDIKLLVKKFRKIIEEQP